MRRIYPVALALLVGACAQIPPSPQQIAAQKMEAVPGKAVIYIVQDPFRGYNAGLALDDGTQIRTWPRTFYRWVTTPGTHSIKSSDGQLNASVSLKVDAGKIYFVQHTVIGSSTASASYSNLTRIDAGLGQVMVMNATLCCE